MRWQASCLRTLSLATCLWHCPTDRQQKSRGICHGNTDISFACVPFERYEKGGRRTLPRFLRLSPFNFSVYNLSPSGSTIVTSSVQPRAVTSFSYSDSLKSFRVNLLDRFFWVCPERAASAVCVVLSFFIAILSFWRKSMVFISHTSQTYYH